MKIYFWSDLSFLKGMFPVVFASYMTLYVLSQNVRVEEVFIMICVKTFLPLAGLWRLNYLDSSIILNENA